MTPAHGRHRRGARRPLAIVVEGFGSRLSFGLVGLALPLFALDLGMSLAAVGLLLSVNVVVALLAKPLSAPLADRFGYRRVLVVAIVGRSAVCALFAVCDAPWQLVAVRVVYGLTQALRDPPLNVLIAEAGGSRAVASTFAWYHTAKQVAASLGRAAAGLILSAGVALGRGEDYRLVFGIAFVLSLAPLGVVLGALRPDRPVLTPATVTAVPTTTAGVARPRVARYTALGLLFGTTAGMLNLFPAIAAVHFGLTPAEIGLIMLASTVVLIVAGPAFGWLADHVDRGLVLSVRGVANIGSSLLYLVGSSLWSVGAAKVVDDAGKAAFRPAWGSVMAEVAATDPARRARTMTLIDVGEDAGDAVGPALAGALIALGGLPLMLGTRCGLAVVTEVWTWWVTRGGHGAARRPASRRWTSAARSRGLKGLVR